MTTVNVDFSGITAEANIIKSLTQKGELYDTTLRNVATSMLGVVKNRIHEEGKDANGQPIGNYSKEYMVVRTGAYKNNLKTKGKNKGQAKDGSAGFYTKGKGSVLDIKTRRAVSVDESQRPNYNRTNDTKVVISLTRQMENDFVVIPTENGYGLGYNNPDNRNKAAYVEATYNKVIFALTPDEEVLATEIAQKTIDDAIS